MIKATSRRGFLTGMASLFAAPAIVSAQNLMPVKVIPFEPYMLVRGQSLFTGAWVETKIMEKAGDPFAFLSEDFYRRFGKEVNSMSMSGLQTAAIESRADEKAMRMFSHPEPQAFRLYHEAAPFAIQTKDHLYGPDEVVYMAHPPENVFCSAKHNRKV
ncbi:hypothetical protein UFOVP120_39 [uncultured Caudovirales phage]|uniref:Uncharacterized protein n=1 Tax=uncultured Caudovirales phage TaxID=2100421 RepID=A0A6J5LCI1_9CAUD|nr:hypothetical protein UFOVP120_39 [uncultured Caudovirales phage]